MAGQGNAKAGRLDSGELDFGTAWEGAGEGARANAASLPDGASSGQDAPFSIFGEGQSEAEAQLYAYLNRATSPRPSGFAPYDELSARLNEFPPALRPAHDTNGPAEPESAGHSNMPAADSQHRSDLAWFNSKFEDLKRHLAQRHRGEIAAVNAKLGEILSRVDRLSAAIPGENAMAAVENRLASLSRSFEMAREQSAADADRISRAAKEILNATAKAEEARVGFETAARHTVKELGQTVIAASSRAAVVTAERLVSALHRPDEQNGLERLENELRSLNVQSRSSGERTAAALERVHDTLRLFLEKGSPVRGGDAPPRKRPSIHMPIAADAPAYSRPDAAFGVAPVRRPQLDTITLRTPPPPDINLINALQEADERLSSSKRHSSTPAHAESDASAPLSFLKAPVFRDEDRGLPLLGLGFVGIMLLLASAALYYLHTKTHLAPFHMTVLPRVEGRAIATASSPIPSPAVSAQIVLFGKSSTAPPGSFPVLFTSAEQNRAPVSPQLDTAVEDIHLLMDAARRGDRDAQFRIGSRFLRDGAIRGDAATAARWLARAADQGHTESLFILASLYEHGDGVPKDESHAIALYRKAASAGHIRAMHNLGVLLAARDTLDGYREAAGWFTQAASAGLTESQYNVAVLCEQGLGLEEDRQKAYFWYKVAAMAGDKEASQGVERLKQLLSFSELLAAGEQAGSWRPSLEDRSQGSSDTTRS